MTYYFHAYFETTSAQGWSFLSISSKFFMAKNKAQEIKRQAFQELYDIVKQEITPTVQQFVELASQQVQLLP